MPSHERISKIRLLLEKNPDDVFLHYCLGREYFSAGLWDEALRAFAECTRRDETYLPARVEAAQCLRAAGRLAEAHQAFQNALALAEQRGETHTVDHIRRQMEAL